MIKFVSSACSYICFICMIIAYSVTEEAATGYTIASHPGMRPGYHHYIAHCRAVADNQTECIEDENVRHHRVGVETIVLSVWIIGTSQNKAKCLLSKFMFKCS